MEMKEVSAWGGVDSDLKDRKEAGGRTGWGAPLRLSVFQAEKYKQLLFVRFLTLKCFHNTPGEMSRKARGSRST